MLSHYYCHEISAIVYTNGRPMLATGSRRDRHHGEIRRTPARIIWRHFIRWSTACTTAAFLSFAAAAADDPATIDLSSYELSFNEEFDHLDVSAWGPGTRWIAHTPWNGDFGSAKFSNPTADFPFTVEGGVLRIEARKDGERWRSGLLARLSYRDLYGLRTGLAAALRWQAVCDDNLGYPVFRSRQPWKVTAALDAADVAVIQNGDPVKMVEAFAKRSIP